MLPVIIFVTKMNQGYASRNITHYKLILMHAPNGVADEIMPALSDLCCACDVLVARRLRHWRAMLTGLRTMSALVHLILD